MTRIGLDAVPECTTDDHERFKVDAETFAANTKFIGIGCGGLVMGNCLRCPSTLAFDPDGWSDSEDTEPMRNAIARPL